MFSSFGKQDRRTAFFKYVQYIIQNHLVSFFICNETCVYIVNILFCFRIGYCKIGMLTDKSTLEMVFGRFRRMAYIVPYGTALHEDYRLMAISAIGSCCESKYKSCSNFP